MRLQSFTEAWKKDIPGRQLFAKFAAVANIPLGRLKRAYLAAAPKSEEGSFAEIAEIFREFGKA
jgi:hypothetical protein